jgi:glycine oxidase
VPDAIVIGGGVMGLGAARELRRRGLSVTLLERAQPGRAASWASAGIIGATVREESDPSFHLRRVSEALWPAFAGALIDESGFDPEYRETGCLYLATDEHELDWLRRVAARAQASGKSAAQLLDHQALREAEPALAPNVAGALLVPGGNVEPRRLCRALEIAAQRASVNVCSGVEVLGVRADGQRVTGVDTSEGTLEADRVVLAAGAWSAKIRGVRPIPPVRPQRGQIMAIDQSSVGVRHVLMTPDDPYFVPRCDGRLVVGATREEAGWDPSLTVGGVAWLLERAMLVVPALRRCPIAELWTGFRPLSQDGLPLIGLGGLGGLYFLTGHGPSGISPLPGSLALLGALMMGEPPPLPPEPFDPLRR